MYAERVITERKPFVLIIGGGEQGMEICEDLALLGCRTRLAGGGIKGIEEAWKEVPDAVVIDVGAPGMDAWETAGIIRKSFGLERTPIMFVSDSPEDRDRYMGNPFTLSSFIPRPLDVVLLERLIRLFIVVKEKGEDLDLSSEHDSDARFISVQTREVIN
jgi:DNA-binding response OmpR family regulator